MAMIAFLCPRRFFRAGLTVADFRELLCMDSVEGALNEQWFD